MKLKTLLFSVVLGFAVNTSPWANQFTLSKNGTLAAVCNATSTSVGGTGSVVVNVDACTTWVNETTTDPDPVDPPPDPDPIPTNPGVDPGFGSGLWIPDPGVDVKVVDQSIANGAASSTTYLPGCVNSRDYVNTNCQWSESTEDDYNQTAYTISAYANQVISVRYQPVNPVPFVRGYPLQFKVKGYDGGNIQRRTDVSLSEIPGDFSDPLCRYYSEGEIAVINIGPGYCEIDPDPLDGVYYLNVKPKENCAGYFCEYKLSNGASYILK